MNETSLFQGDRDFGPLIHRSNSSLSSVLPCLNRPAVRLLAQPWKERIWGKRGWLINTGSSLLLVCRSILVVDLLQVVDSISDCGDLPGQGATFWQWR